jgi:dolichol kinase
MTDAALTLVWLAILGAGVGLCMLLHRRGVAATSVRDLLHVGAGVWVLGWPFWHVAWVPIAVAGAVTAGIAVTPYLPFTAPLRDSVAAGDERWQGLTLYAFAVTGLTAVGLVVGSVPAAAALWALALGDGLGGLVGRRWGRHFYSAPGGKPKSLEGSVAVAVFAAAGVGLAAAWFRAPLASWQIGAAGAIAALAEAVAPRTGDNVVVPVAVWSFLAVTGGAP